MTKPLTFTAAMILLAFGVVGASYANCGSPPALSVSVSPSTLWPPNHNYVQTTATVIVNGGSGAVTVALQSVTSNEPDDGAGDGDTANDIVIIDDYNFALRAERAGYGTGRIYTITYQATDACGNTDIQSAYVVVPLSRSP